MERSRAREGPEGENGGSAQAALRFVDPFTPAAVVAHCLRVRYLDIVRRDTPDVLHSLRPLADIDDPGERAAAVARWADLHGLRGEDPEDEWPSATALHSLYAWRADPQQYEAVRFVN